MKCVQLELDTFISGATFEAEDFERLKLTPPMILFLQVKSLFCPTLDRALTLAWEQAPSATVVVTNLKDTAVFFPSSQDPLRVIATAYLHDALTPGLFIDVPSPDMEIDEDVVLPEGPPQDPYQPLLPDEVVFATHRRHSDFDIATLVRDRAKALQFFRWKKYVQEQFSKVAAHPNDMLLAKTNKAGQIIPDRRPIYSFSASELPSDTAAHLRATQRESPLVTAGVAESFVQSKAFTLKIQDVLSGGSKRSICTVYRCQLTSIDDVPVSAPSLCLKLFDDRFQILSTPEEDDDEPDVEVPRWFDPVIYAETYALNEAAAYDKLGIVQGSVIPWFYGTHQFTLPDETVLTGILMEYIPGWKLDSNFARELSPERQIQMIKSCRHGARILDIADIAQLDWHNKQLILYTNPTTKLDHVVLIDFASTTQTWEPQEPNWIENYFGVLHMLLGRRGEVGIDPGLVWEHFGEPDVWDPIQAGIPTVPGGTEYRMIRAKDMFPFISST
ncbi:hypothetical protein NLI96_g2197 [Meripilus lineatus]|uniref:Uncharacterized protein n=1 Tax=Meripilus lineatus TaxID=2056292 RepID=A0AAD5V919_9APHY|nr:hypothetical protein NLI96_g2197 [Physisporinus lineatus]